MILLPHRITWPVAVVSLLLSAAFPAGEPTGVATYRSSVTEVRVAFVADDGSHRPLDTLRQEEFAVVDNDLVVRRFRSFGRSSEWNVDVTVLVDTSESVLARYRKEISEVMELLSRTQAQSAEHTSVVSFGGLQPRVVCAHNCRPSVASDVLLGESASGATPLFDAVVFSAGLIAKRSDTGIRPVIILFSDGEDTVSIHSLGDAISSSLDSEAQVYTVDLHEAQSRSRGTLVLQDLADATGGRHLLMQDGAAKVLGAVLDDLHSAYVVTYKLPERQPGFHSLRILPTHDLKLKFRCRRGYFYQSVDR